jgi:hypothetical protein
MVNYFSLGLMTESESDILLLILGDYYKILRKLRVAICLIKYI